MYYIFLQCFHFLYFFFFITCKCLISLRFFFPLPGSESWGSKRQSHHWGRWGWQVHGLLNFLYTFLYIFTLFISLPGNESWGSRRQNHHWGRRSWQVHELLNFLYTFLYISFSLFLYLVACLEVPEDGAIIEEGEVGKYMNFSTFSILFTLFISLHGSVSWGSRRRSRHWGRWGWQVHELLNFLYTFHSLYF